MKIRTAAARAYKKRLTIRVYTVYGIAFDAEIVAFARYGSGFYITHDNTPYLKYDDCNLIITGGGEKTTQRREVAAVGGVQEGF